MIRVLTNPAAHPARVVGQNSTNHACVDGRRIRANLGTVWLQNPIHDPAYHSRLDANPRPALFYPDASPVSRDVNENSIGDRLARQTCPGGTKNSWNSMLVA